MSLILNGTTGISDVDGTAAAPALTGTDTNTGIFFGTDIIGFSEGGTEAMRIDASGNVGIGGAATNDGGYGRCLQVTGTEAALELKSGSDFSYVAQNGTTLQLKNNATAGVMTFATEGTERARIDSSGNLMVGTTSTIAAGKASIYFDSASNNGLGIRAATVSGNTNIFVLFKNSADGTAGLIQQNGVTSVTYATSSDYRLKDTIAPMTDALATVAQLKPVNYKWKVDGSDGQGFIAHELQEVVPECVVGEKDAVDADGNPQYQGIDTSFLVATLTAALQEAHGLIKNLEQRVAALEAA